LADWNRHINLSPSSLYRVVSRPRHQRATHAARRANQRFDATSVIARATATKLDRRVRQNNSTGKSAKTCPALREKIFRLTRRANHRYVSARLTQ
jgi:hypothetical protein